MGRVAIGLLGSTLDTPGSKPSRWERWRPTISMFQHDDLLVDRFELIYQPDYSSLAEAVLEDIRLVSPETTAQGHCVAIDDAWDFEEVYAALFDFARDYPFDPDQDDYLVHITTGTHVAQICLFLLTEARYFPAQLLQTSPTGGRHGGVEGSYRIIDLDLSRYDQLFERFARESRERQSLLKAGIETRNASFNQMMDRIERVALRSDAPILLTGPTGAGKTQLARRIYELKHKRRLIEGGFVEVNCATLRGDQAMSALFGHKKGSFTGAVRDRPGLLRAADGGCLFLDEIGELGADEQSMLLRALETGQFLPLGADQESSSSFLLIAGTNRDLREQVAAGEFREDLLARINLWEFELPALRDRREDIEPNLGFELERFARERNEQVRFNKEARRRFLGFATNPAAAWRGNFRDLNAAVTRMATLAPGGRINVEVVDEEIERLERSWGGFEAGNRGRGQELLESVLGAEAIQEIDRFDRVQLADVLLVCERCVTLSEAGRELFAVSRLQRKTRNDADRLRKYLAKFGIDWSMIHGD